MHQLPKNLKSFLFYFLKKQRYKFIVMQLAAFGWSLENTMLPYIHKVLIDKISEYSGDKSDAYSYLMPFFISLIGLWIFCERNR